MVVLSSGFLVPPAPPECSPVLCVYYYRYSVFWSMNRARRSSAVLPALDPYLKTQCILNGFSQPTIYAQRVSGELVNGTDERFECIELGLVCAWVVCLGTSGS